MSPPDAQAFLERMAAGDATALAGLYDRASRLAFAVALRIVRDRADAEDVVQEAFVQAWRQAGRFDPARGTALAWLTTIVRTRALDRLRRRAARREEPAESAPAPSARPRPEDEIAVRRALEALPAEMRRPLELAYDEGLTQVEVAQRLGVPLGTVKTRMRTGLLRLRAVLEPPPG